MDKIVHASIKSGGSDCWGTPKSIVQIAEKLLEQPFNLDAAASKENAICEKFITEEQNALITHWKGPNVWLNPPYSLNRAFLKRCVEMIMSVSCENIMVLIPARTDTQYWHEYVMEHAYRIWLIKGRLKFVGAKSGAPFPSALIQFNKNNRTIKGLNFYSLILSPTERGF